MTGGPAEPGDGTRGDPGEQGSPAPTAPELIYCYACGAAAPGKAWRCGRCHAVLEVRREDVLAGLAYALNHLRDWQWIGALDEAGAGKLREELLSRLQRVAPGAVIAPAATPPPPPTEAAPARPAGPIEPPPTAPPRSTGPAAATLSSHALTEQAPTLLLYLGAFLVVTSAIVFVNVSGRELSDPLKLTLMLIGTIGFFTAGLVCHGIPRVQPAGRTFLVIGALLIPLDVAAYYALVLQRPPWTAPQVWLAGSLLAMAPYGALAARGFGSWYAYLFTVAALSAALAAREASALAYPWTSAFVAAVAVALAGLARMGAAFTSIVRLAGPIGPASRWVADLALVLGVVILLFGLFDPAFDRWPTVATLALAALHPLVRGIRGPSDLGRALLFSGLAVLASAYALRLSMVSYSVVLLLLATAYGLPGHVALPSSIAPPLRFWVQAQARALSYTSLFTATFLFVAEHERAPAAGALVHLGATALLGWISMRRERWREAAGTMLGRPFFYLAALALHTGVRYALLALPDPARALITDRSDPVQVATGLFPLGLALAAAAGVSWRYRPALLPALAVVVGASWAFVTLASAGEPTRHTAFALTYAVLLSSAAIVARLPWLLWPAGAAAGFAAFGILRAIGSPHAEWPLALTAMSLVIFSGGLALHRRGGRFAPVVRQVGLAGTAVAVSAGLVLLLDEAPLRPEDLVDAPLWWTSGVALLALGGMGWIEARLRGSALGAVLASSAGIAFLLMQVAQRHPMDLQAYTIPLAVYLIALSVAIVRFAPSLAPAVPLLDVAGAAVLMLPPLERTLGGSVLSHGLVLAFEAVTVLALGLALRRPSLHRSALAFLAAFGLRALLSPGLLGPLAVAAGGVTLGLRSFVGHRMPRALSPTDGDAMDVVGASLVLLPLVAMAIVLSAIPWLPLAFVLGVGSVAYSLFAHRLALGGAALVGILAAVAAHDPRDHAALVSGAGAVLVALALVAPRVGRATPGAVATTLQTATEVIGLVVLVWPPLVRGFEAASAFQLALLLGSSIAAAAVALALGRWALLSAALTAVALGTFQALLDPGELAVVATAGGLALVLLALAPLGRAGLPQASRDQRRALEILACAAVLGPAHLRSWTAEGFVHGALVLVLGLVLLGLGIVFVRRVIVAGAAGFIGLQAIRGTLDAVDRLPNWATLAVAGTLLLAIGVVLLAKREAWVEAQGRIRRWWADLEPTEDTPPHPSKP